jgi:hypothetical protein
MKTRDTKRPPFTRRCDSCSAAAVGTVTFIAVDGEHRYAVCLECAADALTHPAQQVRLRFTVARTGAEVFRGVPGDAA